MGRTATASGQDDDLDSIVDEVIEAAGGDARAAILGLVRGQHQLEVETRAAVSAGYVRRAPGNPA